MIARALGFAFVPLVTSVATARAQAPGETSPYEASPYETTSPYQPSVVEPPPAAPSVMAHRWAIGVAIGAYGTSPADGGVGGDHGFRVAELAVRYRASPRLELELHTGGGREVIEDYDGDLAMGSVTLAARYRFLPGRPLDWFVLGGLGGTVIAHHASTPEQRDGETRMHAVVGVGVERRFGRFALQAELRAYAIGERTMQHDFVAPPPPAYPDGTEPVPEPPPTRRVVSDQLSGGSFTVGASYYF